MLHLTYHFPSSFSPHHQKFNSLVRTLGVLQHRVLSQQSSSVTGFWCALACSVEIGHRIPSRPLVQGQPCISTMQCHLRPLTAGSDGRLRTRPSRFKTCHPAIEIRSDRAQVLHNALCLNQPALCSLRLGRQPLIDCWALQWAMLPVTSWARRTCNEVRLHKPTLCGAWKVRDFEGREVGQRRRNRH
jgi:hypothetical protein